MEFYRFVINCVKRRKRGKIKETHNTWWWNEQVKDAIDRKKKAFKLCCTNQSAESKNNYRKAKNDAKKVIAKATKQETEEEMNVLCTKPNDVLKFV